ncbi:TlpA family protein disulfide reductase [Winogradskyella haliclonae]|uniref:Thioredoxin domain-containing protein n=1 Tax=Winogradskyella haliclonae TaxID=2048558 RepID=A0ABQ2C3B1_9FLAO|nr:TlpA disulfide reductase family protein [Winogradskyella haliclonae]GGI57608.1 hypothetical protein GCM10011444_19170 [Winogradskyella haliclonae]
MKKTILYIVLINVLLSCKKEITTPLAVVNSNLATSSSNVGWDKITSQSCLYNLKTSINGKIINNEKKEISQQFPNLQKIVSYKDNVMTNITLTNDEGSSIIKYEENTLIGLNKIPYEKPKINPVIELKEKIEDYYLIDTLWNNTDVFYLDSKKNNDTYIFNKETKLLIAYLSETGYGLSTLTFEDYREVNGYLLPFKKKNFVPKSAYIQEYTFQERKLNVIFPDNQFELNKDLTYLKKGSLIPDFTLPTVSDDNKVFSNNDLEGKVTLIDFWATWCKPCIKEFPVIEKYYNTYKNKGFNVISISLDTDIERLKSFSRKKIFPWTTSLYSADGLKGDIAKKFQLASLPKLILVNKEGRIIAMDKELRHDKLGKVLSEILDN